MPATEGRRRRSRRARGRPAIPGTTAVALLSIREVAAGGSAVVRRHETTWLPVLRVRLRERADRQRRSERGRRYSTIGVFLVDSSRSDGIERRPLASAALGMRASASGRLIPSQGDYDDAPPRRPRYAPVVECLQPERGPARSAQFATIRAAIAAAGGESCLGVGRGRPGPVARWALERLNPGGWLYGSRQDPEACNFSPGGLTAALRVDTGGPDGRPLRLGGMQPKGDQRARAALTGRSLSPADPRRRQRRDCSATDVSSADHAAARTWRGPGAERSTATRTAQTSGRISPPLGERVALAGSCGEPSWTGNGRKSRERPRSRLARTHISTLLSFRQSKPPHRVRKRRIHGERSGMAGIGQWRCPRRTLLDLPHRCVH